MTGKSAGQILVVDDEEVICNTLRIYLESEGFQVEAVQSGRAALPLLEHNEFDVLILDILMPHMNGLEVMQWIREHDIAAEVIVTTGAGSQDIGLEAMRLGAFELIRKPILSLEQKLLPAVRQAVERYRMKKDLRAKETQLAALTECLNELYQHVQKIARHTEARTLEDLVREAAQKLAGGARVLLLVPDREGLLRSERAPRALSLTPQELMRHTLNRSDEDWHNLPLPPPVCFLPVEAGGEIRAFLAVGGVTEEESQRLLPLLILAPSVGLTLALAAERERLRQAAMPAD